jgi:hypothetical protein
MTANASASPGLVRAVRAFEQALLAFADESTLENFARYRRASAELARAQTARPIRRRAA